MTRYIQPKTFMTDEETIKILEENLDTRIRNRRIIPKNTTLYKNNEKMITALENAICTINVYMFEKECESTQ